jgi:hypothetical protein
VSILLELYSLILFFDRIGLIRAYEEIGKHYFQKEDYQKAFTYYEKAGNKEGASAVRSYLK